MEAMELHENAGLRTLALVLETGDEVMDCLKRFAEQEKLSAASIQGIGAFSTAVITWFDWETKCYREIPVREQVEVASLNGDIALDPEGRPAVHVHLVLGKRDGSALAGHLKEARVRPTLELVITETPAHLHKRHDPQSGLALIRPSA